MEKRPLFLFAGGFVLGEVLGLRNQTAVRIVAVAALAVIAGYVLSNAGREKTKKSGEEDPKSILRLRKKSRVRKAGLLLFFILCGVIRGGWERQIWEKEAAFDLDGKTCSFTGVVERIRESGDRYELLLQPAVSERGEWLRGLLVYVDRSLTGELSIGFRVRAEGKVSAVEAAGNPGQFDYRSYYRAQKLSCRMSAVEFEIIDRKQKMGDRCRDALRRLSSCLGDILDESADERDAGVLKSMLLGDKSGLDPEIRDLYQRNGIAHLLAISGLHLSLISMAVYGVLRRLGGGYGTAGMAGCLVLVSFCVMTGSSASSVRALVMVLCGYLAAYLGRTYDVLTALGVAGFLILWDSPWQLTQSGVQLSFAAVAGIAAVQESKTLPVSVALQAATVPVILYHYFQLPLYGIVLNLLVLPLVGGVIGSGTLTILCGIGNRMAARFFAGTAHVILLWYDWLCRFFQKLPMANLVLGRPAAWQIGLYYGGLIILLKYLEKAEAGKCGGQMEPGVGVDNCNQE
ncbi:MAG: competence protein ComEC family protein [Clostridiales bacterium]|nr:competence protein ComEC family protein [Clostridiales bacterium]